MFFCASPSERQLRFFCIMFWSSPVMQMATKAPPKNCFQKLFAGFQSQKNVLDRSLDLTMATIPPGPRPSSRPMKKTDSATPSSRKVDWKVSVQTSVLMPPL